MGTEIVRLGDQRGATAREGFGSAELTKTAETAALAVAARERARIEAQYVMAERHPRNWDTVRVRILSHCDRSGFAEVARYKKPAGRKKVNGQWKDSFAEGLSARFAEAARSEMGNTETATDIVYEDDLIRIVRATVVDLERNNIESRSVTIAKAVEKRGKQDEGTGQWAPPDGREVISQRINTYGEPVYLVKATDDEIRSKQNSEISKTTRDETLKLIPKDIRDEAEARIVATLADPKKNDPTAARKRVIDAFARLQVLPDDLVNYCGSSLDRLSPAQLDELRGLYTAISEGETTFQEAMRAKYDTAPAEPTKAETTAEHDIRLERQMAEQAERAKREMERSPVEMPAEEPRPEKPKPQFGKKP